MTSRVSYTGNLRTQMIHLKSGAELITDAPTDNHGKGESFSPTDLFAASLAACILTVMGIKAEEKNWDLKGSSASLLKVMASDPRRVSRIEIELVFCNGDYPEKKRKILERVGNTCPVEFSLHPDIEVEISYVYPKT